MKRNCHCARHHFKSTTHPVCACFRLQTNIADWLLRSSLFAYGELWESLEAENGPDQCLKLLPEKRQTPWPTVDIV